MSADDPHAAAAGDPDGLEVSEGGDSHLRKDGSNPKPSSAEGPRKGLFGGMARYLQAAQGFLRELEKARTRSRVDRMRSDCDLWAKLFLRSVGDKAPMMLAEEYFQTRVLADHTLSETEMARRRSDLEKVAVAGDVQPYDKVRQILAYIQRYGDASFLTDRRMEKIAQEWCDREAGDGDTAIEPK
ncbi:hypothetical protein [Nocardia blacklockiae]|uniref:hypothetical protein n=1 Tax=Nocardia blacklockiae TaxID=480036 RepID=UPI0018947429|nr:hypothetical protein [Nocardia blacklockiae]MBF6172106.1 hypothetical protein [Nocardia blacklockiae]